MATGSSRGDAEESLGTETMRDRGLISSFINGIVASGLVGRERVSRALVGYGPWLSSDLV